MRTFIAIEIPEEIKKKIIEIQDSLPEFEGKKTEYENLHLTLKFLGEVDEEKIKEVRKKLSEIRLNSFKSEIDSLGFFSEKFIKIIWLHMSNCEEIQRQIDEKLKDLFPKEERFMSHLTIARVKNVRNKKDFIEKMNKIKISPMSFVANKFCLKESVLTEEKPVYKDIEIYPLS